MSYVLQVLLSAQTKPSYSWQHYFREFLVFVRANLLVAAIISGVVFVLFVWLAVRWLRSDEDEAEPKREKTKPKKKEKKIKPKKDKTRRARDKARPAKSEIKAEKDKIKQSRLEAKAAKKEKKKQTKLEVRAAKKDKIKPAKVKVKKDKSKKKSKEKRGEKADIEQMTEADYELITERILKLKGKGTSVLFAAAGIKCLPVTIPVNAAIQLVSNKKRCLLIDLDLKRDSVAKAFGIRRDEPETAEVRPRSRNTEFKDMVVWPAHNFAITKHMNIKVLVEAASEKFDLVLINAPYLDGSPDRSQIALAAEYGFIFTQTVTQATRLAELLKSSGCKLIGNIQISDTKPQ